MEPENEAPEEELSINNSSFSGSMLVFGGVNSDVWSWITSFSRTVHQFDSFLISPSLVGEFSPKETWGRI